MVKLYGSVGGLKQNGWVWKLLSTSSIKKVARMTRNMVFILKDPFKNERVEQLKDMLCSESYCLQGGR